MASCGVGELHPKLVLCDAFNSQKVLKLYSSRSLLRKFKQIEV